MAGNRPTFVNLGNARIPAKPSYLCQRAAVKRAVKTLTRRSTTSLTLRGLLGQLNPILCGWTNYFRYAASTRTFAYLDYYVWWRVARWLWKKQKGHLGSG